MDNASAPLTDEERAELEQLRAEKAAREAEERARAERAELEALRTEHAQALRVRHVPSRTSRDARTEQEGILRAQAARERGRKLMEPGDDLSMPPGQKIVLVVLALVVVAIIATLVFSPA